MLLFIIIMLTSWYRLTKLLVLENNRALLIPFWIKFTELSISKTNFTNDNEEPELSLTNVGEIKIEKRRKIVSPFLKSYDET